MEICRKEVARGGHRVTERKGEKELEREKRETEKDNER